MGSPAIGQALKLTMYSKIAAFSYMCLHLALKVRVDHECQCCISGCFALHIHAALFGATAARLMVTLMQSHMLFTDD